MRSHSRRICSHLTRPSRLPAQAIRVEGSRSSLAKSANLAGRSATAAKEIKDLIKDSGSKVDEGTRLVNESGETLEEIVSGVKKVTDIVGRDCRSEPGAGGRH